MKRVLLFVSLFFQSAVALSQVPIDVAESTLKVSAFGEEEFYYGFAEGDQLVFNFEELKRKELKELEIIELPGTSKFMDYKTKRINNKVLNITRTAIYKFRFANSALTGRICKFRLQRIPASEALKNFNTSVYWKTVYDTTYTPRQERYLIKSDTIATTDERNSKVSSQNALNGNRNHILIESDLPPGTTGWSFYIGVGKEGKAEYDKAKVKFVNMAASEIATIPGYGPMAALAIYGINTFGSVQGSGDNVKYWFIRDWENVEAFRTGQNVPVYKQGDIINEAAQMKSPLLGKIYLILLNDNLIEAIDVHVRITFIQLNQVWGTRTINQMNISSRQVAYLNN